MPDPQRPMPLKHIEQSRQESASPKAHSILRGDWQPKLMWGAIKKGRDDLLPVHQWSHGGIEFAEQTGKMLSADHEGESWLATGNFEPGCFFQASGEQVRQFLEELRYKLVRWMGWTPENQRCRRATIEDTRMGLGTILLDGRTIKTTCLYKPLPSDEPLAKYLVLLPATEVAAHGGRGNVEKMPSIGDLEPSTLEIIKEPTLD